MELIKRFDRLLQLFFVLQSRSSVTIGTLQKRFNISKRTIYRDLQALEMAGIPIAHHPVTGYSIMEGYRINPSRFSSEEVLSLVIAEKLMDGHEPLFVKRGFMSALTKIRASFQQQQQATADHLGDKLYFAENSRPHEYLPNVIDVLLESSVAEKIADIDYVKSSEADPSQRKIEPIGIFFEHGYWYMLAYCHLRKDHRNFRLDRIKQVSLSEERFSRQHPSLEELRGQQDLSIATRVTIRVDQRYAHFLSWEREAYGFVKEEIKDQERWMYFECRTRPTAFVRWFLRFVDVASIVEPVDLKEELLVILRTGLERSRIS